MQSASWTTRCSSTTTNRWCGTTWPCGTGTLDDVEEAFAAIRRARELEPTRPIYTANYSLLLYETRRYDEAIGMVKQVIEQ